MNFSGYFWYSFGANWKPFLWAVAFSWVVIGATNARAEQLGKCEIPTSSNLSVRFDAKPPKKATAPTTIVLSTSERAAFAGAITAIEEKEWDTARKLAASVRCKVAADLVEWLILNEKGNDAELDEILKFVVSHDKWPKSDSWRRRAQQIAMIRSGQPGDILAAFRSSSSVDPDTMLALAAAYLKENKRERAKIWIRRAWIEGKYSKARTAEVGRRYSSFLRMSDHLERASRLVWNDNLSDAREMKSHLNSEGWAMIEARIKFRKNARDAAKAYAKVPLVARSDPGLTFDRARWLRKHGHKVSSRSALRDVARRLGGPPPNVGMWWSELQYQARSALDEGLPNHAYELAAGHKLERETVLPFTEAEFLAGWIALQFQNKPEVALKHFERLRQVVTAPTSLSRSHYWLARAHASAGRIELAREQYHIAARYTFTFYGQLAMRATKKQSTLSVVVPAALTPNAVSAFVGSDTTLALGLLLQIDAPNRLRGFATALSESFSTREQFFVLAKFLQQNGETSLALRMLKKGSLKFPILLGVAFPVIEVPNNDALLDPPEESLILAVIRQESEFDPSALSPAGAKGLMQLMPSTAKLTAAKRHIPYRRIGELLNAETNVRIGRAHVSDLLDKFAGSYVLSIAAYNAGAARVESWVSRYGDPRHSAVDTVDWIERIPFGETRNYVQRVVENMQVYRSVLAGKITNLEIAEDLERGAVSVAATQ